MMVKRHKYQLPIKCNEKMILAHRARTIVYHSYYEPLGRMITVAAKIAEQEGIAEDGYRLIMNTNRHGGQEVYHIHMHLLGGRPLGPMLAHKGL